MPTAAPAAEAVRHPLPAAVFRRSPRVERALDPERATARARAWAARAIPGASVEDVRVGSVLYRPDGRCTLRYRVRLRPGHRERTLLVEVPPSGADLVIRSFPDDPGLPTLPRALDPALMREVLGRVLPGTGGERGVGRCAVDVVHHPREGRCVLRYRLTIGAGGPGELRHPVVFGKVYADDAASAAASALRMLRDGMRLLPDDVRIRVPEPLAVVPPLRLGLAEAIPGRALLPDLVGACTPDAPPGEALALGDALRTAARAAATVHACPLPRTPLPVRGLAGERTATERELTMLEPVWPEVAAVLRRGLARALRAVPDDGALAGPPGWPVLAHGDFTPSQVLLDGRGGAGIVDVDTVCLAEPALDLGRFLAYLHVGAVRRSRAARPLLGDLTASFIDAYLGASARYLDAETSATARARTETYRALALARLGARACWQLKDSRLAAVVDVLSAEDGEGSGSR